jgi:hypothetical protein
MSGVHETDRMAEPREPRVRTVQDVINGVAGQAAGRDLAEVERLLVTELDRAGLKAPSVTWLDSVARNLALGDPYVVSIEADGRVDAPPGGHEEDYFAPAHLRVAPAVTPDGDIAQTPPVDARPATGQRRRAAFVLGLAGLPLLLMILRQRRQIRRLRRANAALRRERSRDR